MYNLENKSVEYFNQIAEKFLELSSIKNGNEIRKILRCF